MVGGEKIQFHKSRQRKKGKEEEGGKTSSVRRFPPQVVEQGRKKEGKIKGGR